jgi:hypothetical protein
VIDTTFDRRALVAAWLTQRRWVHAHPDLRDFHARRHRAMADAFGVQLSVFPATADVGLKLLFEDAVRVIEATRTPFSGFLEADEQIHALYRAHGPAMSEAANALVAECRLLLEELVGVIWGLDRERVVSRGEIRACGFDPGAPQPDAADFA